MSRFADGISVHVRESIGASTVVKTLDHKAFERIRNFGQALVHDEAGVVIEFFDHRSKHFHKNSNILKDYHKPGQIYSLRTRKTAYTGTYAVALAVTQAYPHEPFQNLGCELIYSKPYRVVTKEPDVVQRIKDLNSFSRIQSLEPDGIMLNDTHGALMSFANSFDQQGLRDFHDACMGFYVFQKYTNDKGKIFDLWSALFRKKVMLYFGFRTEITQQQINQCRSLNIRPLCWRNDRMVLL